MKLFCRHHLAQDIRLVPVSENSCEARLFGIDCLKCGKHWDHWNRRLRKNFQGTDFISKVKKCLEVILDD